MSSRLLRPEEKLSLENIVMPVTNTKRMCFCTSFRILYRLRSLFRLARLFPGPPAYSGPDGHVHQPVPLPAGRSLDAIQTGYAEAVPQNTIPREAPG